MKHIGVLSGGGIRGCIQLPCFEKIEDIYGKKISEMFSLIVGSSVGSINGFMLASGKFSAKEYSVIFMNEAKNIFQKKFMGTIIPPKYKRDYFNSFIDKLYGKDYKMNQCKTKFSATSVNMTDDIEPMTHYFKSWEPIDGNRNVRDVLNYSFAAPYYFGNINVPETLSVYTDGGCGPDNVPIMDSYIETLLQGWQNEELTFWIFGCGFERKYKNKKEAYDHYSKQSTAGELLSFMKPTSGGLAREMSCLDQVSMINTIAKTSNGRITVKYMDIEIPSALNTMDSVDKVYDYYSYGKKISETIY